MAATDEQILQMAAEIDSLATIGSLFGIKSDFIEGIKLGLICSYIGFFTPEVKDYIKECLNSVGGVKENRYRHIIDERYDTLKAAFAAQRLRYTGH